MIDNSRSITPLILVAGEDPVVRQVMRLAFEPEGYWVEEASDCRQALEKFEGLQPDLLLLDIEVSGVDGLSVCRRIHQKPQAENIPILMVTGLDDVESINRAFEFGITDFITKPIAPALLLPRVRYLLRASAAMNELRESERKLRQREGEYRQLYQQFQVLLDGIPDVLILLSPQMRVVWANRSAHRINGREVDTREPLTCHEFWYQSSHVCNDCLVIRAFASGQTETARVEMADGRSWGVKAFPIKDAAGKVVNVLELASDITESVQLRDEADRATRLASLGELAAGVAHEINNPNALFLMNLPILAEVIKDVQPLLEERCSDTGDFVLGGLNYSELKEELPMLLEDMLDGAKRIRNIVEDLKNFVRESPPESVEALDLNEALQAAVRLVGNTLKKATTALSLDCEADLPLVRGSFQRIQQVIINLLTNACQALPSADKGIYLSTRFDVQRRQVVLEVRDEGVGIPERNLKRITDPFFTTRRREGGTGLGLSVSSRIVNEHGGRLDFASVEGRGTTVSLHLPVYEEASGL